MGKAIRRIDGVLLFIDNLSKWSGRTVSWGIFGMVIPICIEVVSRYFFNHPTSWAHELTTMIYGGYCVLLGAYTHLNEGHVRMDAVYRHFSDRTKATVDFFAGLGGLVFLVLFFWVAARIAWESWVIREFSSRTAWEPPMYPFKTALAIAVLLFLLQHIVTLIRSFSVMTYEKNLFTKTEVDLIVKAVVD